MNGFVLLLTNLLQPIVLAFLLGTLAGAVRSELELPEAVVKLLAIYLLFSLGRAGGGGIDAKELILSVVRGRGILLLVGGMVIGCIANDAQWKQISPFCEGLFRGMLMLFLLEMGITASRQIKAFRQVGPFMVAFGTRMPCCTAWAG